MDLFGPPRRKSNEFSEIECVMKNGNSKISNLLCTRQASHPVRSPLNKKVMNDPTEDLIEGVGIRKWECDIRSIALTPHT